MEKREELGEVPAALVADAPIIKNLNDAAIVTLTDAGAKLLNDRNMVRRRRNVEIAEIWRVNYKPGEDYRAQLWEIIAELHEGCGAGLALPFENLRAGPTPPSPTTPDRKKETE